MSKRLTRRCLVELFADLLGEARASALNTALEANVQRAYDVGELRASEPTDVAGAMATELMRRWGGRRVPRTTPARQRREVRDAQIRESVAKLGKDGAAQACGVSLATVERAVRCPH